MTALVFALQPNQVGIVMDTLVVGANDKKPMSFQSKFLSLPDRSLVVAGTGHAGFINWWFNHLLSLSNTEDIDELNIVAPEIFQVSVNVAGGLDGVTATIYHFGYSKIEARYVGYAYRSTANFESNRLQYGLSFKPFVRVEINDNIEFPNFLIDIVLEQQRQDRLLPVDEQVGIGGEIEFVVMKDGEINIETVHCFASYESEKKYIESCKNI